MILAARGGDASAWAELVLRFQDAAVALAVGRGHWDDADDVAQEAFLLAMHHLPALENASAFPGWFASLVRTASSRRRRTSSVTVSLEDLDLSDGSVAADEWLVRREEREAVRAAVEALPEHERAVITLHYLGGLPHREVATFLGISEAAAKKRAWSARTRLKELHPMVTEAFTAFRPSRDDRFRDTILLFCAIRDADGVSVQALIAKDPRLLHATEDWSFEEGVAAQLGLANKATPLIRAAQSGSVEVVRALVEAGAPVNDLCACDGGESPLWQAVAVGATEVVDYLLDMGADPNATAFAGSTPLHAAAHYGHHQLAQRLVAGGANPDAADSGGRTPGDWAAIAASRRHAPEPGSFIETGLRAVDLFAPLRKGALVDLPPAFGLGQTVVLFQIAQHRQPVGFWHIGFEYGANAAPHVEHTSAESGVPVTVRLATESHDPASRRTTFGQALAELVADDQPKLVVCQQVPGHAHDVTLALPSLAADDDVLATFVIEPFTGNYDPVPDALPEGYDARIAFSPARVRAGLFPAIDPAKTGTRHYPDERHQRLAASAAKLLASYEAMDHELALPDPATTTDSELARKAQELLRYLSQQFRLAEPVTAVLGEQTAMSELLDDVDLILNGGEL